MVISSAIVSALITAIAFALVNSTESTIGSIAQNILAKRIEKLAAQASQITGLKDKLIAAYNQRDAELANALLYSSPLSGTYRTLKNESNRIKQEYEQKKAQIEKVESDVNADVTRKSSASSLNALDTMMGRTQWDKNYVDKSAQHAQQINQLVSGDATTLSKSTSSGLEKLSIVGPKVVGK